MRKLQSSNINTPEYWDKHQTALDYGLRQKKYEELRLGNSLLEIGCGLSPFLSMSKANVKAGLDFSHETCRRAASMYPSVVFVEGNALRTPFPDRSFDTVVAGELIEHINDPQTLINEMKRIAKKRIIVSTPRLEFEDPEHVWEFELSDLVDMMDGDGFKVESERFPGRIYYFAYADV